MALISKDRQIKLMKQKIAVNTELMKEYATKVEIYKPLLDCLEGSGIRHCDITILDNIISAALLVKDNLYYQEIQESINLNR